MKHMGRIQLRQHHELPGEDPDKILGWDKNSMAGWKCPVGHYTVHLLVNHGSCVCIECRRVYTMAVISDCNKVASA